MQGLKLAVLVSLVACAHCGVEMDGAANYHDYSEEIKTYTEGSYPAEFASFRDVFVNKMRELKYHGGPSIDDHDGTPIGQGRTIAFVKSTLEITNIEHIPPELRSGLVAKKASYESVTRVSHTNAADMDLMRIAVLAKVAEKEQQTLHFTETIKNFPMGENTALRVFTAITKGGLDAVAVPLKHPVATAKMAATVAEMKKKFGEAVFKRGVSGKEYYSLTPYELAEKAVIKFALIPRDLTSAPPSPYTVDGLESDFRNDIGEGVVIFDLKMQIATHPSEHPINDAGEVWDETSAPFRTIGRLTLAKSTFSKEKDGVSMALVDQLSNSKTVLFAPGESLHKPVGDIAFFRRFLYPQYDKERQDWLLDRHHGECPFAAAFR